MKTINISDEDYETLMELSKELQTQPNHSQAFPYFWEPASRKLKLSPHDEGEVVEIFHSGDQERYSPEEFAEHEYDLYNSFLEAQAIEIDTTRDTQIYKPDLESEWVDRIAAENIDDVEVISSDWEQKTDHNPSLFLSDVQRFIKSNAHHLGKDPHTYARTIWRMPKMERLIEAIYRLNPQPKESVNQEASRFVFKEESE